MPKAVVTGGAGFIGSHLCEPLLARDWCVVAIDSFDDFYDPTVKRSNLDAASRNPQLEVAEGDIRDAPFVDGVLSREKPDVPIHLAARAGVRPSIEKPLLYQDVNVTGTSVLLEGARQHGIGKFIFASSSSVYGNNKKIPFAETDRVDHAISPYAATKKAGALICQESQECNS